MRAVAATRSKDTSDSNVADGARLCKGMVCKRAEAAAERAATADPSANLGMTEKEERRLEARATKTARRARELHGRSDENAAAQIAAGGRGNRRVRDDRWRPTPHVGMWRGGKTDRGTRNCGRTASRVAANNAAGTWRDGRSDENAAAQIAAGGRGNRRVRDDRWRPTPHVGDVDRRRAGGMTANTKARVRQGIPTDTAQRRNSSVLEVQRGQRCSASDGAPHDSKLDYGAGPY
jgi:hypothetical protein